ncbi:MAG: hypothetical protein QM704_11055 [Anaeromyxobacteraceae bacterium]
MDPIAVPTLYVVGFALSLLASAFLVLLWTRGPALPGMREWAGAAIACTLSRALVVARPVIPIGLSALASTTLSIGARDVG